MVCIRLVINAVKEGQVQRVVLATTHADICSTAGARKKTGPTKVQRQRHYVGEGGEGL